MYTQKDYIHKKGVKSYVRYNQSPTLKRNDECFYKTRETFSILVSMARAEIPGNLLWIADKFVVINIVQIFILDTKATPSFQEKKTCFSSLFKKKNPMRHAVFLFLFFFHEIYKTNIV